MTTFMNSSYSSGSSSSNENIGGPEGGGYVGESGGTEQTWQNAANKANQSGGEVDYNPQNNSGYTSPESGSPSSEQSSGSEQGGLYMEQQWLNNGQKSEGSGGRIPTNGNGES